MNGRDDGGVGARRGSPADEPWLGVNFWSRAGGPRMWARYDGAVGFETVDKSGTCSLDVDFSLQGDVAAETGSATLTGRVCGITFTHNLTLS